MPKALPAVDISAPLCCAPVSAAPISDDAALQIALRLKALADPVRIKLMSLLLTSSDRELCTCDLAASLALAESTVSHHLSQLKKAGLVEGTRRGMNVYYRVRAAALDALRLVLDPNCCEPQASSLAD
ncbi:metalloregulator ArsR/SmtB family transcription factor [Hoyosella sp. YIM 151337]|uniref:Rv2640c family ArsR-like transcriptional regulator n=1 Tax=Hoyosella sp. YIM 151337 TaxID=2992742 RepID=UPI0022368ED0|nr:Rv2640c family ArsR-like transcriptional regulator [Hoyosella sp. YIM 151337]MCW4354852.1 metalloregulator ArsR/SmtB family transcription factor [Hoyosella sp. YIM 151337]